MNLLEQLKQKVARLDTVIDRFNQEYHAVSRSLVLLEEQLQAVTRVRASMQQTIDAILDYDRFDPPGPAGMLETSP